MTVRQVFYQATVRGLVDKSELGYKQVQSDLVLMRRAGELPYDWLADNTRWQRKPNTFGSVGEALREKWPYLFAIELDATEPDDLRAMVRRVIEQDLSRQQLKILQAAGGCERELIQDLVARLGAAA